MVSSAYTKWCLHLVATQARKFLSQLIFELPSSVEMSKLGLLSAGFSAILGRELVLQEGGATSSIHDVFKQTYVMKPPGFRPPSPKPVHEKFPIFVKGLFGFDDTLTLQVT